MARKGYPHSVQEMQRIWQFANSISADIAIFASPPKEIPIAAGTPVSNVIGDKGLSNLMRLHLIRLSIGNSWRNELIDELANLGEHEYSKHVPQIPLSGIESAKFSSNQFVQKAILKIVSKHQNRNSNSHTGKLSIKLLFEEKQHSRRAPTDYLKSIGFPTTAADIIPGGFKQLDDGLMGQYDEFRDDLLLKLRLSKPIVNVCSPAGIYWMSNLVSEFVTYDWEFVDWIDNSNQIVYLRMNPWPHAKERPYSSESACFSDCYDIIGQLRASYTGEDYDRYSTMIHFDEYVAYCRHMMQTEKPRLVILDGFDRTAYDRSNPSHYLKSLIRNDRVEKLLLLLTQSPNAKHHDKLGSFQENKFLLCSYS